jgi:drug/metabolite transporter (DMT)-like permease
MMIAPAWLWIVFTVAGSAAQTARTAMQRELIDVLGTIGATHVRFLFGLPFGLLFLALVALLIPDPLPPITAPALTWIAGGAVSQIAATALMLAAMRERSFVVATALVKIEPVWIALAGAVFLSDPLTPAVLAAILVATLGVLLTSWPRRYLEADSRSRSEHDRSLLERSGSGHGGRAPSAGSAVLGLAAGALFGFAAIGYRGGIGALGGTSFVAAATLALAIALTLQTALLTSYLALRDPGTLRAIARAWRPSLFAGFMGALASLFWFLAFALQSAALVRTVALIEILFALFVSRGIFQQRLGAREGVGLLLLVAGVAAVLNAA